MYKSGFEGFEGVFTVYTVFSLYIVFTVFTFEGVVVGYLRFDGVCRIFTFEGSI